MRVLNELVKGLDSYTEIVRENNKFNLEIEQIEVYNSTKLSADKEIDQINNELSELKKNTSAKIKSTPKQFIKTYSKLKPSDITHANFKVITDHENILLFGRIELDTKDYFAQTGQKLIERIDTLKNINPSLEEKLNNEFNIFIKILGSTREIASSYLNSTNIPPKILSLYPSFDDTNKLSMKKLFGDIAEKYSDWIGENIESEKPSVKRALILSTIVPCALLTIASIPILLPYYLVKNKIVEGVDTYMSKRDVEWKVHAKIGKTEILPAFWNYLSIHPEFNTPVNFEEDDFTPNKQFNDYLPRIRFKINAYKLYSSMLKTLNYYENNPIPAGDQTISEIRNYVINKISTIDNLIAKNN